MGKSRMHKDLDVWKESIELVKKVYEVTSRFPKEEIYSLTAQIRRSAVSIPSNIAEGAARNSKKEFIRFLYIGLGSCSDLDTQLIISKELGYLDHPSLLTSILDKAQKIYYIYTNLMRLINFTYTIHIHIHIHLIHNGEMERLPMAVARLENLHMHCNLHFWIITYDPKYDLYESEM